MVKFENERAKPVTFENRKCRDIFWLLLFVVFIIGMVRAQHMVCLAWLSTDALHAPLIQFCVLGIAFTKGNYKRVTNGMDYRGYVPFIVQQPQSTGAFCVHCMAVRGTTSLTRLPSLHGSFQVHLWHEHGCEW